jgi:hypothetical protein
MFSAGRALYVTSSVEDSLPTLGDLNFSDTDCQLLIDQSCKQATVAKTCLAYFE